MAASTKAMHQIRQIFELRQQQVGLRKIERLTGFSRNTVCDYVRRASSSGRSLPELLAMVFDFGFVGAFGSGPIRQTVLHHEKTSACGLFSDICFNFKWSGFMPGKLLLYKCPCSEKYPLFFGLYVAAGWLQGPFQPHPRN